MAAADSPDLAQSASDPPYGGHAAQPHHADAARVFGLILAGGANSRMRGMPKGLLEIGERTMLARVRGVFAAAGVAPSLAVASIGASWQAHPDAADLALLPDAVEAEGPLAALSSLASLSVLQGKDFVMTLPWDCPFLPHDLVRRMLDAALLLNRSIIAADDKQAHPSIALWRRIDLLGIAKLFAAGERRLLAAAKGVAALDVRLGPSVAFANVNTPEELDHARKTWELHASARQSSDHGVSFPAVAGSEASGLPVVQQLDLTGLKCPLPVLRIRKALHGSQRGAVFAVLATDPMAGIDIPHFCLSEGHVMLEKSRTGDVLRFVIRVGRD